MTLSTLRSLLQSRRVLAACLAGGLAAWSALPHAALAAGKSNSDKARDKESRPKDPKPRAKPAAPEPELELQTSPVVEACVSHHTRSQELRLTGKLLESRVEMRKCAAEACPALLQRDCVGWLDQMDTQIPSVTFRATVDGEVHTDGDVFIDGTRRPELMAGKAVELNPGKHRLRFVLPGLPPHEQEVISSEGERYRMIEVALTSPPREEKPDTHRPVPIATYVLGSVAIAGAVGGGIWGASSMSLRHELENSCAPACPERRVDELRRRALFTDISWGVSALSLIGAATFFLFRPELPLEVDVAMVPGGGMSRLRFEAF